MVAQGTDCARVLPPRFGEQVADAAPARVCACPAFTVPATRNHGSMSLGREVPSRPPADEGLRREPPRGPAADPRRRTGLADLLDVPVCLTSCHSPSAPGKDAGGPSGSLA